MLVQHGDRARRPTRADQHGARGDDGARRRRRVSGPEFRSTHVSSLLGAERREQFVATPEVQGGAGIGGDPLPPGQVWAVGPGGEDEGAGLYRIEGAEGPGSGVRIANVQAPGPFREAVWNAEQHLYGHAKELAGDREPRHHELTVQLRALDPVRTGAGLGVPTLLAFCTALLGMGLKGGLVAVGGLNLGGGIKPPYSAVAVAELAAEKGAEVLLAPIPAHRQLNDLSDAMAARLQLLFYTDARDALLKARAE